MTNELQHQLQRELRSHPCFADWSTPELPPRLLSQVVGRGGTTDGFQYGGFTTSLGIRAVLTLLHTSLQEYRAVLDFGCGPARVLRWLAENSDAKFHGVDINADAIQWCRNSRAPGEFAQNPCFPPLPVDDSAFDLAYAVSVFTHIDEQCQIDWLRELSRVLTPGGVFLATVHGRDKARRALAPLDYVRFSRTGFFFHQPTDRTTLEGMPDFYQVSFHSREYIERTWTRFFDVLFYVSHGPFYEQEMVVLRNRRQGPRSRPADLRLPLASLDSPTAGSIVSAQELIVSGWAFLPDERRPVDLDIWIDGVWAGHCSACRHRPDVGTVFRTRHAGDSGFSAVVTIPVTDDERHSVWITSGNVGVPLAGTFFRTGARAEDDLRSDPGARTRR